MQFFLTHAVQGTPFLIIRDHLKKRILFQDVGGWPRQLVAWVAQQQEEEMTK
jgi:hypothetical protein